ncbi:hypothetical protein CY34DRAFT_466891 [Suillus luteus UH-Slu-Lm8-n1]|uniref:Uncharacterized protein n=1 Tax=Suillus luteus UH-Slu-Lm8-n1 TaxID=930992 RepID=A0A0D0AZQ7_9AGAM|nr:hypothetical protein CY34DRAFT_466891 [Suillus luteus UH-Slu-Lm8-n1]
MGCRSLLLLTPPLDGSSSNPETVTHHSNCNDHTRLNPLTTTGRESAHLKRVYLRFQTVQCLHQNIHPSRENLCGDGE